MPLPQSRKNATSLEVYYVVTPANAGVQNILK